MTNDAGITEQALHIGGTESGDRLEVETGERGAEVVPLAQDGQPRKAGLKPFEADLLEQPPVIGDRPSPLVVVVADIKRVVTAPPTAGDTVGPGSQPLDAHHPTVPTP